MADNNLKRLSKELESVKQELADAEADKMKMSFEHQSETNELKKALVRMEKEINSMSESTDVKQVMASVLVLNVFVFVCVCMHVHVCVCVCVCVFERDRKKESQDTNT